MIPRVGHKGIGEIGFGCVLTALLIAAYALYTANSWILPFAAGLMMWGQYFAASNVMTIPSMVAKTEYRGQASCFNYMFSRSASFMSIFLFPLYTTAVGKANATLTAPFFRSRGCWGRSSCCRKCSATRAADPSPPPFGGCREGARREPSPSSPAPSAPRFAAAGLDCHSAERSRLGAVVARVRHPDCRPIDTVR